MALEQASELAGMAQTKDSLCFRTLSCLLFVARKPTHTKHSRGMICSHTEARQSGQPASPDRRRNGKRDGRKAEGEGLRDHEKKMKARH